MIKSITTMKPVWNSSATYLGPPWRLERGDGVVLVYAGEHDIHPAIEIPLSNVAEIAYDTEAMAQDREVKTYDVAWPSAPTRALQDTFQTQAADRADDKPGEERQSRSKRRKRSKR